MPSSLAKKRAEGIPSTEGITVTQYWVCVPIDPFQKGAHIYEIEGQNFSVVAYPADLNFAKAICSQGRKIAEVEVHNYSRNDHLAHKKDWIFKAWIK